MRKVDKGWLNDAALLHSCNGLIIETLGVNKFRAMSCNRALMTAPLNTVLYTNICIIDKVIVILLHRGLIIAMTMRRRREQLLARIN